MSVFPLEIPEKINTPELQAFFQQFGLDRYLSAEEINKITAALAELKEDSVPNVGEYYQAKSFDRAQIYTGTSPGTDVVIPLNYQGCRVIILQGTIVNIKGLSMSLIESHMPDAESPHEGKIFTFINDTPNPIIFNHYDSDEDICFLFKGLENLVIPSKERIDFMFRSFVMDEHKKSWVTHNDVIGLLALLASKADLVAGKVPLEQLPSYVDDVLEYANLAAFPITGEASKIYLALDTNFTYRWTGSVYVKISDTGKLDKVTTVDVEKVYIKNADGTQSMKPTSEFVLKKTLVTNTSVSGTFNIDAITTDTYRLTLIGNTTFALVNFSATNIETVSMIVTGNFAVTYPVGAKVIGSYTGGSDVFQFVIEKIDSQIYIIINKYV